MEPGPPQEELGDSAAVFAGEVVGIEVQDRGEGQVFSSADPVAVTFRVSKVWKGPAFETLVVITARNGASCGYTFNVGQEYLVYTRGRQTLLETSICSRTQVYARYGEDIAALGPGIVPASGQAPRITPTFEEITLPTPEPSPAADAPDEPIPLATITLIGIGLVVLAAAVLVLMRPRHPATSSD